MLSWLAASTPTPGNPPSARSGTPAMAWGGLFLGGVATASSGVVPESAEADC